MKTGLPDGWSEDRNRSVISYYESQADRDEVLEIEDSDIPGPLNGAVTDRYRPTKGRRTRFALNPFADRSAPKTMRYLWVVGTIIAVALFAIFVWPTLFTYTTYEQQTKKGLKIIVEVRTSRFSNEEETRWNGGKWSPGRVIID